MPAGTDAREDSGRPPGMRQAGRGKGAQSMLSGVGVFPAATQRESVGGETCTVPIMTGRQGMWQFVECLPSIHGALGSVPTPPKLIVVSVYL